ncbi:MAG TPA: hypothetical protein RMH99_20335 [Sandaracinaceae bacterium LLY-WYZ-13_1]|nr:hypothetical protein [Sandaracinaceae bacterium LLY-WYZ-13_1]
MPPVPEEVLERVAATVAELVDTPELARFTLASGRAPAEEAAGLGADAVVDVFRTDDPDEALEIERALHLRFATHDKARLDAIAAAPSAPVRGTVHVFVALWAVPDVRPP